MSDVKTKPTRASVKEFLASIDDESKRRDCRALITMMRKITGEKATMWGPSIVGFGTYHYKYESGREGDWFTVGFSPRKQALTLYIMAGFSRYESLLAELGTFKTGKSCLYVKRLDDVDLPTLEKLIRASVEHVKRQSA